MGLAYLVSAVTSWDSYMVSPSSDSSSSSSFLAHDGICAGSGNSQPKGASLPMMK